jgi:hypothetical protein
VDLGQDEGEGFPGYGYLGQLEENASRMALVLGTLKRSDGVSMEGRNKERDHPPQGQNSLRSRTITALKP